MDNFVLVSPILSSQRRGFSYGTPAELKPTNANPLLDGEWLEFVADYKLDRGTANPSTAPAFPVFTEQGRYETQALGRVSTIFLGAFEADTKIFTAGSIGIGTPLTVNDVTFGGLTRRGLIEHTGSGIIIGYSTRAPSNGVLRFIRTLS